MKRLIHNSVTLLITILTTQLLFSQTNYVMISDAIVNESDGAVSVTIFLNEPAIDTVVVDYMTETGLATQDDFYFMPEPMQAVFYPGTEALTLVFEILDDPMDELDEQFYISLLSSDGALIEDQQAIVTILDNDAPPCLIVSDVFVDENAGMANVMVSMDVISGLAVSLSFATEDISSISGIDHTSMSGSMSIPSGMVDAIISVPLIDDILAEANEKFDVVISDPVNSLICDGTGTVTIMDNDEEMTITCGADMSVSADPGLCSAAVNVAPPTIMGMPIGSIVSNDMNSTNDASDTYALGITTVTWTVADPTGNTVTCSQDIIVMDYEDPIITCSSDQTIMAGPDQMEEFVVVSQPIIGDNCSIVSIVNDYNFTDDASSSYPLGTTIVTWTVTDASGNTSTCNSEIIVTGEVDPLEVTCPTEMTLENDPGICGAMVILEPEVMSNSAVDTWITMTGATEGQFLYDGGTNFNNGTTTVNFNVQNSSGNSASCVTTVTVLDTEIPVFESPGPQNLSTDVECSVLVPDYTFMINAQDNCSVNSIQQVPAPGTVMTAGFHDIIISVTDDSGNFAIDFFTLSVIDDIAPEIICQDITVALNANGIAQVSVTDLVNSSYDNCGIAELWAIGATFDATDIGVNMVEVIGYDYMGNSAYCLANVTVEEMNEETETVISELEFDMWPNPTFGEVVINKPGKISGFTARVMDLSGKIVHEMNYENESKVKLDLNALDAGIYMITLTQGKLSKTKRVVKTK